MSMSAQEYTYMGLGDLIAWLALKFGIKQLEQCGCKDRQAWLHRFPLVWRKHHK